MHPSPGRGFGGRFKSALAAFLILPLCGAAAAEEGPQVESRSGWDVDGVEIRVILDFGAGFIDHRGWFMNAGA